MGKFLWENREKSLPCWLSQFSSFKPKVAIADICWKMQRKAWYSILGLDAMPLSHKNLLLSQFYHNMHIIPLKVQAHWILIKPPSGHPFKLAKGPYSRQRYKRTEATNAWQFDHRLP